MNSNTPTQYAQNESDLTIQTVVKGGVTGTIAFIINYAVIYAFSVIDGVNKSQRAATWKIIGWNFFGAHNVKTEFVTPLRDQGQMINPLVQSGAATLPRFLYYLVPVVVLTGAGYLLYSIVGASHDTVDAAKIGATISAGYVVLAFIGTFLFTASWQFVQEIGRISPDLVTGVVVAGVLYPVFFGALGAIIAVEIT